MRRPFDWLVICLALLVLWANRFLPEVGPEQPPTRLGRAAISGSMARDDVATRRMAAHTRLRAEPAATPSPFAYIREDGTQVFLPAAGTPAGVPARVFEKIHAGDVAAPAERVPAGAVYSWSTTVRDLTPDSPQS